MKPIARALLDFFLAPADADPWEQNVVRGCSLLLAITVAVPCLFWWGC